MSVKKVFGLRESCLFCLPADVDMFGAFDILTRENLRHMNEILTNKDDDDIDAVLKAKEFYQLCLQTNFSDVLGAQSLLAFLNETGRREL